MLFIGKKFMHFMFWWNRKQDVLTAYLTVNRILQVVLLKCCFSIFCINFLNIFLLHYYEIFVYKKKNHSLNALHFKMLLQYYAY